MSKAQNYRREETWGNFSPRHIQIEYFTLPHRTSRHGGPVVKFNMLGKKVSKSIQALTMVDKVTNWPEVAAVKTKSSLEVSQVFDQEWLCRYPRPYRCIHDNGSEFLGLEFQKLLSSYGILSQATAVKTPRGNSVVETMRLTDG